MNRDQATALAKFIHTVRPEWDQPGIFAALAAAKDSDPLNAAMAAIRWTANPECRTPGAMGRPGPHWSELVAAPRTPTPPKPDQACQTCGRHLDACTPPVCGERRTRPPSADRAEPTDTFRSTRQSIRGAH